MKLIDCNHLTDLQHFVEQFERDKGFIDQSVLEKCLMLNEEVGELCKAIRQQENIKTDPQSRHYQVADELADVLMFLCSIANRYNIDLMQALRRKNQQNQTRTWQ